MRRSREMTDKATRSISPSFKEAYDEVVNVKGDDMPWMDGEVPSLKEEISK